MGDRALRATPPVGVAHMGIVVGAEHIALKNQGALRRHLSRLLDGEMRLAHVLGYPQGVGRDR